MVVDLSDYWDKIVETGEYRNNVNKKRGSKNLKVTNKLDDAETHILGVAGEVAVKIVLNLPVEEVWEVKTDGNWPKTDGEYFGEKYQVKSRSESHHDMIYNPKFMNLLADIYLLVVSNGGDKKYNVVGWLRKKELKKKMKKDNLGHGTLYLIKQKEFKPILSLIYEKMEIL